MSNPLFHSPADDGGERGLEENPAGGSRLFPRSAEERREAKEDYALRKVPNHWKRSPTSIGFVLTGAVWSVFSFALGGGLALAYGLWTALIAVGIGFLVGSIIGAIIARETATFSVDIDLLSRGSGYGFLGSSVASLVYAINFLMYCGFEAAFVATAVHTQWPGIDLNLLYVLAAVLMIPINWYGVSQNDLLQRVTTPLFLIGLAVLAFKAFEGPAPASLGGPVTIPHIAAGLASVLPLAAIQALVIGDWSRFAHRKDIRTIQAVGPLVAVGGLFLIEAPLGALFALWTGEENPGAYAASLMGVGGVAWLIITQVRVQNGNYYSASLALANFSARVLRFVPGRQFWLFVVAAVTIAATVSNVLEHLLEVLTFLGVFLLAWIGTMVADIVVVRKRLRLRPDYIEHRRGYLTEWGWPALGALVISCAIGGWMTLADQPDETWGPFLGEVLAFFLAAAIYIGLTVAYRRKFSLVVRKPSADWIDDGKLSDERLEGVDNFLTCGRCHGSFIKQDMVECPVTEGGAICSVCCSSHSTCGDVCKTTDAATVTPAEAVAGA
jgi:purine-cytosine permease-like protein